MDVVILTVATILGFYMAANIGSNDLANAMGTSVGSCAITLKQAVVISIVANALGAVLAGGYVTGTISKGIIDPSLLAHNPNLLMLGMFASLLAAGLWVNLATYMALPVSTSHAIVGAVVGFGILSVGAGAVTWNKIILIVASWITSPAIGALIAGGLYRFIDRKMMSAEDPLKATHRYVPYMVFMVFLVLILSFIFKGLKNLNLHVGFFQTVLLAIPFSVLGGALGLWWVRRQARPECALRPEQEGFTPLDRLFAQLQVLTACYVAFAHGANDVANAVGPLAAIFSVVQTKAVALKVEVPFWMLLGGGMAVGGGLMLFGTRVMETIGKNITELTPLRGFCAEFGAATTILICSRMGLPISTTHVLVGSVVGVGIMRGMGTLDLRVLKNIALSWGVTLPFTVLLSMLFYKLFVYMLL
ncbi:MAG: inorganic phosphate transporter [Deltaproteobacteria bacterium]|nr:inorganic phosphate transporter [Deltaproteobacteria bacterium]MBW1949177.1 inorganic phosphate transporter [Deltaproteobacteria bacterium]MBW2007070.1 inorganic phosphate transporter [Deltaproteobacteria bacterium]MBW2347752.1 inorganic phosphate transporter [Deltaproteobacteria bacterium]RLB39279.1 MAG: phosphate permease [Deltaproteobacteria bacterium]